MDMRHTDNETKVTINRIRKVLGLDISSLGAPRRGPEDSEQFWEVEKRI